MEKPEKLIENEAFMHALCSKIKQKHQPAECQELEGVRLRWHRANVVHTATHEVCEEHTIKSLNIFTDDTAEDEVILSLKNRLVLAEAEQFLQASDKNSDTLSQINLLGVQSPQKLPPPEKELASEFQKIINKRIEKKLLDVSQFYQPSAPTAGVNLLYAKASQFHHLISKDTEKIDTNKKEIEKLKHQRLLQMRKLYGVYTTNLKLFETLIIKYKLSALPANETQIVNHLSAKTEAFAAKIRLIEKEMLASTYKPDIVNELSKIRDALDMKLAQTTESLHQAENEYQSCLSAGSRFQQLAKEYAQLKKDIEARTWALNELKTAKQHKTYM